MMQRPQRIFYRSVGSSSESTSGKEPASQDEERYSDHNNKVHEELHPASQAARAVSRDTSKLTGTLELLADGIDHDFLSVNNFIFEHQIPVVDINDLTGFCSTPGETKYSEIPTVSTVGTGSTCKIIQHMTQQGVKDIAPGTVVALKMFIQDSSLKTLESTTAKATTWTIIHQELDSYVNPTLRGHENISQLLYVAWHPEHLFPFLALEMASFGSLEHILASPGAGPTQLQRANISIDVANGLGALHSVGIVHGDIKTDNILIQSHDQRQIVAKLADFGGAADTFRLPKGRPTMGTELWWPPELLHATHHSSRDEIDWHKADIYAFGLVIASIWARPFKFLCNQQTSCCILHQLLNPIMEQEETRDWITILKHELDDSPNGVLIRSIDAINAYPSNFTPAIESILFSTLSIEPQNRKGMLEILRENLPELETLCKRDSVTLPNLTLTRYPAQNLKLMKVWKEDYLSRSQSFQRLYFNHIYAQVEPASILLENAKIVEMDDQLWWPATQPQCPDDANIFLSAMLTKAHDFLNDEKHNEGDGDAIFTVSRLAYHVAASFHLGAGTEWNEDEASHWKSIAALTGNVLACVQAPSIAWDYANRGKIGQLASYCLTVSALLGVKSSIDLLRQNYPAHFEQVIHVIRNKGFVHYVPRGTDRFCQGVLSTYLHAPLLDVDDLDVLSACSSQNHPHLCWLLFQDDSDASIIDERNAGLLHYLSLLEDDDIAAELAPLCFAKGAKLDSLAREVCADWPRQTPYSHPAQGSPLTWAVSKGMDALARAILDLHIENNVAIPDGLLTQHLASRLHSYDLLDALFGHEREHPDMFSDRPNVDGLASITKATQLILALDCNDLWIITTRRISHGINFLEARRKTVEVLLNNGARPDLSVPKALDFSGPTASALSGAVEVDDHISLDVILRANQLGTCQIPDEEINTLLSLCLVFSSKRCFEVLLNAVSDVDFQPSEGLDYNAFNLAVRQRDPFYALTLLSRGADIHREVRGVSPLLRALLNSNLEVADVLLPLHTPTELSHTWGPNRINRLTAIGLLFEEWFKDRRLDLLDALRWLHAHGGALPNAVEGDGSPSLEFFFKYARPRTNEDELKDVVMADLLFTVFPLQLLAWELLPARRNLLALAISSGHYELVKLLLSRRSTAISELDMSYYLEIATLRSKSERLPPWLVKEGAYAIRRFRNRIKDIFNLLMKNSKFLKHLDGITKYHLGRHWSSGSHPDDASFINFTCELPRDATSLPISELDYQRRFISVRRYDREVAHVDRGLFMDWAPGNLRAETWEKAVNPSHGVTLPLAYREWLGMEAKALREHSFSNGSPRGGNLSRSSQAESRDSAQFYEYALRRWDLNEPEVDFSPEAGNLQHVHMKVMDEVIDLEYVSRLRSQLDALGYDANHIPDRPGGFIVVIILSLKEGSRQAMERKATKV